MRDVLLNSLFLEYLKHEKPAGVGDLKILLVLYALFAVTVAAVTAVCVGVLIWLNAAFHLRLPEHLPLLAVILGGFGWWRKEQAEQQAKRAASLERVRNGVAAWATVVMANEGIFKLGTDKRKWPALVLVSSDETLANDPPLMMALVKRLFYLKANPHASPDVQAAVEAILKERPIKREGQRYRLPDELTDGIPVFAVDLFIHRRYLKEGRLTASSGRLPCLIELGEQGMIWHLPHELAETSPAFS